MEMAKEQELILVLDFGSQYNQLITRRIREMGVYSELHDHEISIEEIKRMNPKGIILSGGPNSVYEENSFTIDPEIYNLGIPILGICYGMQLTTKLLGGKVERANEREYGKAVINAKTDELFFGLPEEQNVWMSHSDKVIEIPEGFEVIADSQAQTMQQLKINHAVSMVFNSILKYVILNLVTIYYVTSYVVCVNVLVNGQWKTLLILKLKKSANLLVIARCYVQ